LGGSLCTIWQKQSSNSPIWASGFWLLASGFWLLASHSSYIMVMVYYSVFLHNENILVQLSKYFETIQRKIKRTEIKTTKPPNQMK